MKFGKVLKVSSENMPSEMHDLFLRYKELKKKIKAIPVNKDAAADEMQASVSPGRSNTGSGSAGQHSVTAAVLSAEEQAFITTLNEDLARFNRFFIEKEEEAVIRLQALCDELAASAAAAGFHVPAELTTAVPADPDDRAVLRRGGAAVTEALEAAAAGVAAAGGAGGAGGARGEGEGPEEGSSRRAEGAHPHPLEVQAWPHGLPAEGEASGELSAGGPHDPGAAEPSRSRDSSGQGVSAAEGGEVCGVAHVASLQDVKSRLVRFHGEMVLLLHWSLLNYAAVVKILKKHDKRTGVLLRAPYLANVLQQPFSSTTIMSRLAKRAEELVVATTHLPPGHAAAATVAAAAARGLAPEQGHGGEGAQQQQPQDGAPRGAAGGPGAEASAVAARGVPDASAVPSAAGGSGDDAATLASMQQTGCASEGGARGGGPEHAGDSNVNEPLVGRTMAALETWANLRKNAITPSTVLLAAEKQQAPDTKRKAAPEEAAAGDEPPAKQPRAGSEGRE